MKRLINRRWTFIDPSGIKFEVKTELSLPLCVQYMEYVECVICQWVMLNMYKYILNYGYMCFIASIEISKLPLKRLLKTNKI